MEKDKVTDYSIILIGGSAGALEVIFNLLPEIKPSLQTPIILIIHRLKTSKDTLAELLAIKTNLQVKEPDDKEPIQPGTIYLAPADYHLLIEKDHTISLDNSEKVNHSRPSIDVTFESAAEVYGKNVLGIILSGANADGAAGAQAIKDTGGGIIIQNPSTATMSYMPMKAMEYLNTSDNVSPEDIVSCINSLK